MSRHAGSRAIGGLAVLFTVIGLASPLRATHAGELRNVACDEEMIAAYGSRVRCQRFTTRMYPDRTNTASLETGVIHLAAEVPQAGSMPLLVITGGNGAGLRAFVRQQRVFASLARHRNLVVIDHRGAGTSVPKLGCPQFDGSTDPLDAPMEVLSACAADLERRGVDVNAFGAWESAHDIAALRRALNLAQWDVYAVSYGTTVAQQLISVDGAGIRALALDGAAGLNSRWNGTDYLLGPWESFFDQCRNDARCRRWFPRLEANVDTTLRRLERASRGRLGDAGHSPAAFVQTVRESIGDPDRRYWLPAAIRRAAGGDDSAWIALRSRDEPAVAAPDPSLVFLGTVCRDEYPRWNDPEPVPRLVRRLPDSLERHATDIIGIKLPAVCGALGFQRSDDATQQAGEATMPLIALVGALDTITPASVTRRLASQSSGLKTVEFPVTGHWVLRHRPECGASIVEEFLRQPQRQPEAACVRAIERQEWARR